MYSIYACITDICKYLYNHAVFTVYYYQFIILFQHAQI